MNFCTAGFPVNPIANRATNGLAGLPVLFPDANVIPAGSYQLEALNEVSPGNFDGTRLLLAGRRIGGNRGEQRGRSRERHRRGRPPSSDRIGGGRHPEAIGHAMFPWSGGAAQTTTLKVDKWSLFEARGPSTCPRPAGMGGAKPFMGRGLAKPTFRQAGCPSDGRRGT